MCTVYCRREADLHEFVVLHPDICTVYGRREADLCELDVLYPDMCTVYCRREADLHELFVLHPIYVLCTAGEKWICVDYVLHPDIIYLVLQERRGFIYCVLDPVICTEYCISTFKRKCTAP